MTYKNSYKFSKLKKYDILIKKEKVMKKIIALFLLSMFFTMNCGIAADA